MDDLVREECRGMSESVSVAELLERQARSEKVLRKLAKRLKKGKKDKGKKRTKRRVKAFSDFGAKFLSSLTSDLVRKKFFS